MKPVMSVIVPSIRTANLKNLYRSFQQSFHQEFEFIIISPYELPDFFKGKDNVKYFQDWGTPIRCQQIGLVNAQGGYIHRAVDDSSYVPDGMDKAFIQLLGKPRTVISMKYTETNASVDRGHKDFQNMLDPKFYELNYHHQTLKRYVPFHYTLINFGIYPADIIKAVGGWDCQFESQALGELDLAIRLQFAGYRIELSDDIAINCGWTPGIEGDHAPMHYAFDVDNATYAKIYNEPTCEDRVVIDINNWQNSPAKWERRFGK